MRIAVMSDIHGNIVALDAVLADCRQVGDIDEYWILGDLVAIGPAPVDVLQRIDALPKARCIRGNTDRYIFAGDRPPPTIEEAAEDSSLLLPLVEVAGTMAWTQGALSQTGHIPWLADLPLEMHAVLQDGTRVLGVHSYPGSDTGLGFRVGERQAHYAQRLSLCEADLVLAGHHHRQLDVTIGTQRAVNVGSVSMSLDDLQASYAIVDADDSGHRVELRRADYDRDAVIDHLQQLRHPGAGYIIRHLRGTQSESPGER
jgi:predicted phosphodiesterase